MIEYYKKIIEAGFNKITINNIFIEDDDVFVMLEGKSFDIYSITEELLQTNLKFIVTQKKLDVNDPRIIVVENTKIFLDGFVNYYQYDKISKLKFYGVTGTNGKTTTSMMYYDLMKQINENIGYLGTLGIKYADVDLGHNEFTTPPINMMYEYFSNMVDEDIDNVIMETSAQGFDSNRLSKIKLGALAWLNFQTMEHGEYYDDYEDYFNAKLLGFSKYLKDDGFAIIPQNDEKIYNAVSKVVSEEKIITFGIEDNSSICISNIVATKKYQVMDIKVFDKTYKEIKLHMQGTFAPLNLAVCVAYAYVNDDIDFELFMNEINNLKPQKSNFEFLDYGQNFDVVLDTTHTVDGYEKTLSFIKDICKPKRLIHVFGCHGYRDEAKRPIMGSTSEKYSDLMILTSDYSRDESQQKIIDAIKSGIIDKTKIIEKKARKRAIEYAIANAQEGDFIFITGKAPHEYEEFDDGSSEPFDMSDYQTSIDSIKERLND